MAIRDHNGHVRLTKREMNPKLSVDYLEAENRRLLRELAVANARLKELEGMAQAKDCRPL